MRPLPAWLSSPRAWPAAVLALGLLLALPRLGASGFWEPKELAIAETAVTQLGGERAQGLAGARLDARAAVAAAVAQGPPVRTLLPALGMAVFGAREPGARSLVALSAVATLLALFWAGAGLFGRRAGALAALVLAATPLFVLEARQLTSDMPLLLGGALALGGLGRFLWPPAGRRRPHDLALGVAGLALGTLTAGALVGALLPGLALAAAAAVAGRERGDKALGPSPLSDRAGRLACGLLLAGVLALALGLLATPHAAGRPSWLLGGTPQLAPSAHTFEALLRRLGFGLFPFGPLAFFALGQPLVALDDGAYAGRPLFADLVALFFAAFALALGTVGLHLVGEAPPAALLAAALATGAFLDRHLTSPRRQSLLALLAAVGTLIVGRDLLLAPEELASLHLGAKIAWPATRVLPVGALALAVGVLFGAGLLALLALPRAEDARGRWRTIVRARAAGLPVALGAALAFAFFVAQGLVPALGRHLSRRALVETFHRLAPPGGVLARYRVPREGSGFFDRVVMQEVGSAAELAALFRDRPAAFALVPRAELAALDDALGSAGVSYAVVDDSSSRHLLLAARRPAGADDRHPLRAHVWRPGTNGSADHPPWAAPAVPASAVFGDAIELVGADFPRSVRRPADLPLTLHFRVLRRPPPNHKIFVHLQRPGQPLVLGDHAPLAGAYPTQHWRPDDRLRDEHAVELPLVTTPAGSYALYLGFWPGGNTVQRLPVTAGPHDGQNRVALGTIEVR